jgi:MoaA/NifB/PqqE/SkfB family radical SAM enzyme
MSSKIKFDPDYLYIKPITQCNLSCKMCYANVINGKNAIIIDKQKIIDIIDEFFKFRKNKKGTIYWCGSGEVFLHKDFPEIINLSTKKYGNLLSHEIMTNGTIDRLSEFDSLKNIHFFISIDGLEKDHDWNRGTGNFVKTINFAKKCIEMNCLKLSIRTILTKDNLETLDKFKFYLEKELPNSDLELIFPYAQKEIDLAKSESFTKKKIDCSKMIPKEEIIKKIKEKYGKLFNSNLEKPDDLYVSITPSGIFTCCDSKIKIGNLNDDIKTVFERAQNSEKLCRACPLFKECSFEPN